MRAYTIKNCEIEEVDSDSLLYRRLVKSVELSTKCDCCKARATQHINCQTQHFSSYRCNEHGGEDLIGHPDFRDQTVRVEILGSRHWRTYRNGQLLMESYGS